MYIYRSKTQEIIWSFIRRTLCFMHYTFFSCYYEKTGVADYLLIFVDFCWCFFLYELLFKKRLFYSSIKILHLIRIWLGVGICS